MFTLALRRHMKGTKVKVLEVFPPAFATGLSVELESEGEKKTGPEAVANVAKTTVAGILAGEEQILPHPQSVQLFEGLRRSPEALTEMVNKDLKRKHGWDQKD